MQLSGNPREDIAYEVRGTFRAFANALITELADADISVGFFHILRISWPESGRTQKDIAELAFMTPSVASQQIQKMCAIGLLHRQTDSDDTRKKIVKLTKMGREKKRGLVNAMLDIPRSASEDVSTEDLQTTLDVLSKLRTNLK